MDKSLDKKIHWFYLAAFFLIAVLPLIAIPPLLHPASWAKTILFRIIISCTLLVILYQAFFSDKKIIEKFIFYLKDKRAKVRSALWILIAFGAVYILSTIFSLEPHFSFWGNPARGIGAITIVLLIIYSLLIFLVLREKNWQKFWIINISIGILVSLVALIQKFRILPNIINPGTYQPFSTIGSATMLGIYLMLLIFVALSLGLKQFNKKSFFYFGSIVFFVAGLLSAASRSPILGFAIGVLFFLFFYPKSANRPKKIIYLKITALALIVISVVGAFWLKAEPKIAKKLEETPIVGTAFYRIWDTVGPLLNVKEITFEKIVSQGRYSGWQVLWPALKDRPILGYGPDNISIAFDKYYDPSIKGITSQLTGEGSGWWDKAHDILLEFGITIGIPGLMLYLLIFIVLFLKLQRAKKESKDHSKKILILGIQAAFISYFTAVLFNFDSFSTYLIIFSLIAYSLFLIKKEPEENNSSRKPEAKLYKYVIFTIAIFVLVWFSWVNINALLINKKLNDADFLLKNNTNNCKKIFPALDTVVTEHSFIDNYVRLKYIDLIASCIDKFPENELEFSKKAVSLLEEAKKLRPYYTRSWIYSAVFLDRTIESDQSLTDSQKNDLANQALENLDKAAELSPKRQDIFLTYVKTYLLIGEKEQASQKAEECIKIDSEIGDCYWARALTLIASDPAKNSAEALEQIKTAISKGYTKEAYLSISQLVKMYSSLAQQTNNIDYYKTLKELYIAKIQFDSTKFQDHASLAFVYRELGDYDNARKEAAIVLQLSPESKPSVDAFLKTLPE
jgi:O-Antigen ligase